jgi:hypothetical protein
LQAAAEHDAPLQRDVSFQPRKRDKMPEGLKDGNGPQCIKTKAEVIIFLSERFICAGSQGGGYIEY